MKFYWSWAFEKLYSFLPGFSPGINQIDLVNYLKGEAESSYKSEFLLPKNLLLMVDYFDADDINS